VKATQFEFRFRLWIGFAIYVLGFWAPWLRYGSPVHIETTWLELSGELGRLLPLQASSVFVTSIALFLAALGAMFRVWGTAYLGGSVVHSHTLHARDVVAAGPYRHVRNPLYLGSFLFVMGMAILMPASGAAFAIVASFVQMVRLILREEEYLGKQQGEAYRVYKSQVPRLLPRVTARVPQSAAQPQWLQAAVGEIFYLSMTACFAVLAWRYNASLLTQALLVCFGLSLVARAVGMKSA
jgi:protein-S-isoprenylcysteine O-methyltransferase Ste14